MKCRVCGAESLRRSCSSCREVARRERVKADSMRRNLGWEQRQRLLRRDGAECVLCGRDIDCSLVWPHADSPSVDHIQPLALGGLHREDNTRLVHLACNVKRGVRAA